MANITPPNLTTAIGQVRTIIGDDDSNGNYVFSDDQIQAILVIYSNNIKLTSAFFFDKIATDTVLLYKIVRTDDLQVDGGKMAEIFLKRAKQLRDEDAIEALEDAFEIVYPEHGHCVPEATARWYRWDC